MIIKCIIVDDDEDAIQDIEEYISKIPNILLVKSFTKPDEALHFIKNSEKLDLVFIDVDMPLISGIEISKLIRENTKMLVFTTAHAKYALDAFDVNADGFLLKPFDFSKFYKILEKLFKINENANTALDDYLFIKNKDENLKLFKVKFDEILAIESLLNYIRVYTINDTLVTHISLKDFSEIVKERDEFIQLHRSYIVSKKHIYSIDGNILKMSNGATFSIGESYKNVLNAFLGDKILKPIKK